MKCCLLGGVLALTMWGAWPSGVGAADDHAADPEPNGLPPGMIAVPASVRENLGITFVKVERRRVADTLRLPGRFEALPQARAEYRAGARGIVEFLVDQYDRVEAGTPLYRLDSAHWRSLQKEMIEAELAGQLAGDRLALSAEAAQVTREAVALLQERVKRLEALSGQGALQESQLAEAQTQLAEARARLAEVLAIEQATRLDVLAVRGADGAGNPRLEITLREAATLMGAEESWLVEMVDGAPRWKSLRHATIVARQAGIVDHIDLEGGGLVAEGALVLGTIDPGALRFRGFALQADIARVAGIGEARIVPPYGSVSTFGEAIDATLMLGTEADPDERSIDLIATPTTTPLPAWARPGMAAFVEVTVAGGGDAELAIPLAAVLQDELERVFFLRDRNNPDRVRRVVGDLGADDGRWVVVNSGIRPGDEVVVDGAYELKLAGSGKVQAGGHFHADGTFHATDDH